MGLGWAEGQGPGGERAGGPELGNRPGMGGAMKGAGTLRTTGGLGGDVERTGLELRVGPGLDVWLGDGLMWEEGLGLDV